MPIDDTYLDAVRRFEGFYPRPYWDVRQWTSGYGTRAGGPGEVIDRAEAERRLVAELTRARDLVRGFGVQMTPGQEAALTSLTFNAGDSWMRSGLGAAIRAGDWDRARGIFTQYVNADGQPLPGLVRRRAEEVGWFDHPVPTTAAPGGNGLLPSSPPPVGSMSQYIDHLAGEPIFDVPSTSTTRPPQTPSTPQTPPSIGPWQTTVQPEPPPANRDTGLFGAMSRFEPEQGRANPTAMGLLAGMPPPMPMPAAGWLSNPLQQQRRPGMPRAQFGLT